MTDDFDELPGFTAAYEAAKSVLYPMVDNTEDEIRNVVARSLLAYDPYLRTELFADLADEMTSLGFPEAGRVLDYASHEVRTRMADQERAMRGLAEQLRAEMDNANWEGA